MMAPVSVEHEAPARAPDLGARIVTLWLIAGFALAGTILFVSGWRRVLAVWAFSAVGFAVLLIYDAIIARFVHRPKQQV